MDKLQNYPMRVYLYITDEQKDRLGAYAKAIGTTVTKLINDNFNNTILKDMEAYYENSAIKSDDITGTRTVHNE
jgi:predicted DNA-binding protein